MSKHKGMKNLEKREVRSHNKMRALLAENKVRFARANNCGIIVMFDRLP